MTSDQNSPDVQQSAQGGPPPASHQDSLFSSSNTAHGMGQSKSSRRRRRKRKSKSEGGDHADAGAQVVGSLQGSAEPKPTQSFQPAPVSSQGANGAGAASTGKRWKKKFRDRQRTGGFENNGGGGFSQSAPSSSGFSQNAGSNGGSQPSSGGGFRSSETHQFGNNAGGGYKRKGSGGGSNGGGGKQQRDRGPRSFVGPMDHSYRAVNGNFAEAPPSTIETRANGNFQSRGHARPSFVSDSQPIDYSQGRAIPIAEDAPTKIIFFIEDLFFLAKIQETARKLGVKVAFLKNDKESIATLTSAEEADRPSLIVFDLNNANAKPLTLIPKLKTKLKKSTSIIGFLSHLQGDLKAKAVEAGCDTVIPRSAFSQNLPNLLRRYGIVEEEEANYNM